MLIVAKGLEVLLNHKVLPLALAIRLRVEGGRAAVIDTDVGAHSVPKWALKHFAAIVGDNV